MRGGITGVFLVGAVAALLPLRDGAAGAAANGKPQVTSEAVRRVIEQRGKSVELVTFPQTQWSPVKIVRGTSSVRDKDVPRPTAAEARPADVAGVQVVSFADPRYRPVSILRGSVSRSADAELFGPASAADLDRVAFAVDGAESSHGADWRMWRPEPSGPQGPMQVTAAAAFDVGGGDRFDIAGNRALGRAYLDRLYRRYGNWPDAIAAYNWGPGNVDSWISGGRPANQLPLRVERYRDRVLREAALTGERSAPASPAFDAVVYSTPGGRISVSPSTSER